MPLKLPGGRFPIVLPLEIPRLHAVSPLVKASGTQESLPVTRLLNTMYPDLAFPVLRRTFKETPGPVLDFDDASTETRTLSSGFITGSLSLDSFPVSGAVGVGVGVGVGVTVGVGVGAPNSELESMKNPRTLSLFDQ